MLDIPAKRGPLELAALVDYALGIDVGTTYTAAAIARGGIVEMISLSSNQVAVPSVIFATAGEMIFGAPAVRRGAVEPGGLRARVQAASG